MEVGEKAGGHSGGLQKRKTKLVEDFYKAAKELNLGDLVKVGWRRSRPSWGRW